MSSLPPNLITNRTARLPGDLRLPELERRPAAQPVLFEVRRESAVILPELPILEFEVLGKPATQGSMISLPVKTKEGYAHDETGKPKLRTLHDSPALGSWRSAVATAAHAAKLAATGETDWLYEGCVRFGFTSWFLRPNYHFCEDDPTQELRSDAPTDVGYQRDIEKLLRAMFDALTGVLWRDDGQVSRLSDCAKLYGPIYRTIIRIEPISKTTGQKKAKPKRRERQ